jgi:hypothetical protein
MLRRENATSARRRKVMDGSKMDNLRKTLAV